MKIQKNVLSWALYDWANSAFATTIMAGFFPLFFQLYWSKGADPAITTAKLGTTVSFASFIIAFMAPFLGAAADLGGLKKKFLFLFFLCGAVSTFFLGFVGEGQWLWAAAIYGLAFFGFTAANIFYDSLLPFVAKGQEDSVSSLGFGLGYLGGGLLLVVNVLMYQKPEMFGFADGTEGIKASFMSVALWWALFSIPLFAFVKEPAFTPRAASSLLHKTKQAWTTVLQTLRKIRADRNLFVFLLAYWLYIDGVYTVITMAVNHGVALGFKPSSLIAALVITQFVGFPSAIAFGRLARPFGCRKPILFAISIYILVVLYATQLQNETEFFILAAVIGLVQGGVQALSRSFFAKIIPPELSAEYFGFFNLVGKFASIIGPLIVAIGAYLTGSTRYGILGLLILFFVGGALLLQVKEVRRT